jgi:hemerythrin-like domain-containing protein
MTQAPNLLNDDGSASMATLLMMSHHAFRLGLARMEKALEIVRRGDASRSEALREEWTWFHRAIHGHHESEDTGVFPSLAKEHESVRATIEKLGADHRLIDPMLEQGDKAFADLPNTEGALAVVRSLRELLATHLATEEAEIIPFLRSAKTFPPPPNDEVVAFYAQGFAWAMHGIAPDVVDRVHEMLPEAVTSRLPAAHVAFAARCERAWGSAQCGAARTPIPDEVG